MKTITKTLCLIILATTFCRCQYINNLMGKDEPTPPEKIIESQSTVTIDTIKEPTSLYVVGEKVLVHWGKKWWNAKVIKAEKNRWLISYDGYDSSWDEWVGSDRIKKK